MLLIERTILSRKFSSILIKASPAAAIPAVAVVVAAVAVTVIVMISQSPQSLWLRKVSNLAIGN
jgi:hypothetical protein